MADKKERNKNIRKLTRMGTRGTSIGLTLPIEIVEKLKWKEKQKVVVSLRRKHIIIKDWER